MVNPDFAHTGALLLREALPLALWEDCRDKLREACWRPDVQTGQAFAFDTCALDLPELERWIAEQSAGLLGHAGLPGPAHFRGALKRLQAGPRYRFPWHRDHRGGRLLGMSINLSEAPCEGGVFEQRLRWETEPSVRIHSKPRDLHLFDVSDSRRVHRVTQLTAGSRVVFAGWWRA